MAKKLDPTTKLLRKFQRHIDALERASIKSPTKGKGAAETRAIGCMTAAEVFARAIQQAKVQHNRKIEEEDRQRRINLRVKALFRQISHLYVYDDMDEEEMNVHARQISNCIKDVPARWTGYRTQSAIDSGEKVHEHFYPRQWAGYQILYFILDNKGISFEDLRKFVEVFRQVHYTTVKENNDLKPSQDHRVFQDWVTTYDLHCTKLVMEDDRGDILKIGDLFPNYHK